MLPLAVTLGDPAGVGPELIAAAWAARDTAGLAPFFAVGGAGLLAAAVRQRGLAVPIEPIADPAMAPAVFPHALPVLVGLDGAYRPGQPSREGADLAIASLAQGVGLTRGGHAAALVTAPIAKARLAEAGWPYPGQTECVADACGVMPEHAVMLLAGPSLKVVPLTVHIALAEVPRRLTSELIVRRARIAAQWLARDFGIASPRLAVAALNPHAGEEGRMGDEEGRIIAPAIAALQAEGFTVSGPHPADALFTPRARSTFDVALCMYHDQALVPLKALDFDEGVNVTLGLPVIRTSPDHGTAFAIAGSGQADPGAMIAAIRMAGHCAARRAGG